MSSRPLRVTVVCTGNICRSPIGEAVLRHALEQEGLDHAVVVDSAGIGAWHVGDGADRRAVRVLARHGYDGSAHVAQQVTADRFTGPDAPDLVLAMDSGHVRALGRMHPEAPVRMYRSFDPALPGLASDDPRLDVPDPFYERDEGFVVVLRMIEAATPGVVAHLRADYL